MSTANYNRPKPVDPLWFRLDCDIVIHCACGHHVRENLHLFAAERRLRSQMLLHEITERLKCSKCGRKPASSEVIAPD